MSFRLKISHRRRRWTLSKQHQLLSAHHVLKAKRSSSTSGNTLSGRRGHSKMWSGLLGFVSAVMSANRAGLRRFLSVQSWLSFSYTCQPPRRCLQISSQRTQQEREVEVKKKQQTCGIRHIQQIPSPNLKDFLCHAVQFGSPSFATPTWEVAIECLHENPRAQQGGHWSRRRFKVASKTRRTDTLRCSAACFCAATS